MYACIILLEDKTRYFLPPIVCVLLILGTIKELINDYWSQKDTDNYLSILFVDLPLISLIIHGATTHINYKGKERF